MTCLLLVASLLSPGVAMAKGGNGHNSDTASSASPRSGKGKAAAPSAKDKAKSDSRSPSDKHTAGNRPSSNPAADVKPKAAPRKRQAAARVVEKQTPEAPKPEATEPSEADVGSPRATLSRRAESPVPRSLAPTAPSEGRLTETSTDSAVAMETRGVLDTIRLEMNASLNAFGVQMSSMWSALTNLLGD